MNAFQFHLPTRILFGPDTIAQAGEAVKAAGGSRVLVLYGTGSVQRNGVLGKVLTSLDKEGLTYFVEGGIQPNPRLAKAQELAEKLRPEPLRTLDVTTQDLRRFLEKTPVSERIILLSGDGTIHHFINRLHGVAPQHPIYYAPGGSGNDFMNDVQDKAEDGFILLNPYLENLPVVEAAGERRFFVNNVGFGIDGYCCEMGDQLRSAGQKNISYSGIAIKGLLGKYKPTSATITVDGVTHRFDHVWLAPTMNGRYYGGGMKIAPEQDRLNEEKTVSVVALHCRSKLKTLTVFPSIFKGEHVRHQEMVSIFTGHEIAVTFDRPTALQIDGETIPGVSSYQVTAAQEQAAEIAG